MGWANQAKTLRRRQPIPQNMTHHSSPSDRQNRNNYQFNHLLGNCLFLFLFDPHSVCAFLFSSSTTKSFCPVCCTNTRKTQQVPEGHTPKKVPFTNLTYGFSCFNYQKGFSQWNNFTRFMTNRSPKVEKKLPGNCWCFCVEPFFACTAS